MGDPLVRRGGLPHCRGSVSAVIEIGMPSSHREGCCVCELHLGPKTNKRPEPCTEGCCNCVAPVHEGWDCCVLQRAYSRGWRRTGRGTARNVGTFLAERIQTRECNQGALRGFPALGRETRTGGEPRSLTGCRTSASVERGHLCTRSHPWGQGTPVHVCGRVTQLRTAPPWGCASELDPFLNPSGAHLS